VCALLSALPIAAQTGVTVIGTTGNTIGTVDMVSGAVSPHTIVVTGKTGVGTSFGVARDPQTGTVYAVVNYFGVGGRHLITLDPATGVGTHIGQTSVVSDIAFGADGTLYAIGGNSGGNSGGLLTLDKTTGAATLLAQLSAGAGHTLAFNADDGLLYHGANTCDNNGCFFYLETFNPQSPATPPNTVYTLRDTGLESGGLIHLRGPNFLLGTVFGPAPFVFVNVKTGASTYASGVDVPWSGLTAIPVGGSCPASLYATGPFEGSALLHAVDPATGTAALVGAIGFNNVTGIDFASDGVLYALGTRDDDSGVQVLLTIDPCTGEGTEVGWTGTLNGAQLREMAAMPNDELLTFLGQDLETISRVTGGAMPIGVSSGITADDFGLEYSPVDDKLYFATVFNGAGTLYAIDPGTGAATVATTLTLPPNITALRALDFNPGNNTMYALIADSTFPGTTSLATVNTTTGAVSIVAPTNRFTALAFQNGTPSATYQLTVIPTGSGSGGVTSSPNGIDCGATCQFAFNAGTQVTLTATPGPSSQFEIWSGGCSGAQLTCVVSMNAMTTVRPNFVAEYPLTVTRTGAGSGTVTAAQGVINCGATCTDTYLDRSIVILTATAQPGSIFTGWSGDCSGTGDCQVTMSAARNVTANFALAFTIVLTKGSNGFGSVTPDVGQITCNMTCTGIFPAGTTVTLTAAASPGSSFAGWSGGCTGTGTCVVTSNVTATINVTATFDLIQATLTVQFAGLGSGEISTEDLAFCQANCTFMVTPGTQIALFAFPHTGSVFSGWSGACTGTQTCVVTMDTNKTVIVTFSPPPTLTFGAAPPAVSVNAGQPAGFPINLQVRLPFPGTVVLSCSGLPAASVCTFNPNNIPIPANQTTSTNSQLTITTTARTVAWIERPWAPHPVWAIGIVAMFGFSRRKWIGAMLALALLCVILLPSCGGGGHTQPKTQFGTPAGTYTVTVNATSGTTNQTSTVTLTVH
jgi:hypothetical protein